MNSKIKLEADDNEVTVSILGERRVILASLTAIFRALLEKFSFEELALMLSMAEVSRKSGESESQKEADDIISQIFKKLKDQK